jgi:hypothetical protein
MIRLLCTLLFLGIPASASALDAADVGTYAVIHRDGHVTDFTFFVSLTDGAWNIEERKPDGSWSNVTCQGDCVLRASGPQDIARFFPADALAKISPSCVHNSAFALCTFTASSRPESKSHVLIALITPQPTPLPLKKLADDRRAP